ncbi:MAG: hypothetical protein U1E34_10195 [Amaricoccus sp.]
MLTAHQRIALTRAGFLFEPITGGGFVAIWPHPTTAWPYEWQGGDEPDERHDVEPIAVDDVRFIVWPNRVPARQVVLSAAGYDKENSLLHWVPELDDAAVAARERLQDFVERL